MKPLRDLPVLKDIVAGAKQSFSDTVAPTATWRWGDFFKSNFFVLLVAAAAILVAWGRLNAEVENWQIWMRSMQAQVNKINEEGTAASKREIEIGKLNDATMDTRIKIIESRTDQIGVILERLDQLRKDIAELKSKENR